PKRKTAKRLLGIIKGTDPSSLTWFEKLHLNTAFFFGTELGWLYRVADKYLDVQHNAEHDTHNGENEPLLPSEVVSTSSSKTVKEQAEVVSTSSSKTVKEQVGWVAYFDQKTPPSTDRRDELNNNNNRVENSPESVQANDAFLESPRPG
ncbi:MAG: hypothetical protein SFW07_08330, partial [Gammaproteobacteria bacterium]|nr:hypothetical protein [Gammaproteobacteria bacterium]